jgi:hypothetical protein
MKRWLPLLMMLWSAGASAGDGRWAGVPIDHPEALGLGRVTPIVDADAWQAALADGEGFVRVWWSATTADAIELFTFQRGAAVTTSLPTLAQEGWDDAAGDGTGLLLVRLSNVVILVRDHADTASQRVIALQSHLVATTPGTPVITDRGGVSRDVTGRRVGLR